MYLTTASLLCLPMLLFKRIFSPVSLETAQDEYRICGGVVMKNSAGKHSMMDCLGPCDQEAFILSFKKLLKFVV